MTISTFFILRLDLMRKMLDSPGTKSNEYGPFGSTATLDDLATEVWLLKFFPKADCHRGGTWPHRGQ
jgi:hypothetical protein